MAIIDRFPGVAVTIAVNGEDLQEYPDTDGPQDVEFKDYTALPGCSSTKYVECVSDKEFTIALEVNPQFELDLRYEALVYHIAVDGNFINGQFIERDQIRRGTFRVRISESRQRISKTEVAQCKLRFSKLRKVDDAESDRVKADSKVVENLGEIIVLIQGVTRGKLESPSNTTSAVKGAVTEVAEKALKGKALSHGVRQAQSSISKSELRLISQLASGLQSYTVAVPSPVVKQYIRTGQWLWGFSNSNTGLEVHHSPPAQPVTQLTISQEALQSELIIPRSPSPDIVAISPSPDARDASQPNAREQRLAALKEEIDQIKREEAQETSSSRKRPAEEIINPSTGKAYKTSHAANGDLCVDLTDD